MKMENKFICNVEKEELLIQLYDSAINSCVMAIDAIRDDAPASHRAQFICRLQDVVIELNNSLNLETNSTIISELSSLYDYILFSSTQANMKNESSYLISCRDVLKTLREGWVTTIEDMKQKRKLQ